MGARLTIYLNDAREAKLRSLAGDDLRSGILSLLDSCKGPSPLPFRNGRGRRLPDAMKRKIRNLKDGGMTISAIARKCRVARMTVRKV